MSKGDDFMKRKYFYPKISHSILLVAICLGLQLLSGLVAGLVFYASRNTSNLYTVSFLLSPICTGLTALLGIYVSKTKIGEYLADRMEKKRDLIFYLLFFLGAYCVSLVIGGILETFLPTDQELNSMFLQGFNSWIGIISIVVLAPIFEEALFRGVILRGFLKNYGAAKSIIISAVLFGILHMNPIQSVTASFLGLALGWIFVKTGSLWACILFHAFNNGLTILIYHVTTKYNVSNFALLLFVILSVIMGWVSFFILSRKPNGISHILKERDDDIERQNNQEVVQYSIHEDDNYNPQGNVYSPQDYIMPIPIRHSGLGIASFIISMSVIVFDILFLVLTVAATTASLDTGIKMAVLLVFLLIFGVIVNLVGAGLGIAGLFSKNKKRVFAILGTIFNVLTILIFIGIIIAGTYINKNVPIPINDLKVF